MAKSKLDAVADAAALSAVDHNAISGTADAAKTTATTVFNAEAINLKNVTIGTVTVTVTDANGGRTAVVSYTATKTNTFMGALGIPNTAISGTATAQAGLSVNINFYLLLDNSPSMNIAATSSGIQTMVNNTSAQGGCAFACHESNPSADNLGNPNGEDNYTLAQKLGVVTRMQNLATATQSLMTTASATEGTNTSQYQMAIYTFANSGLSTIQALTSNLTAAKTAAGDVTRKSVRFIEIWARPRTRAPNALTPLSPPPESRTSRARARARATSGLSRKTFQAIRKRRAPTALAPAVGCRSGPPTSGRRAGSRRAASRRPSNCPCRTSSSRARSGRAAAAS